MNIAVNALPKRLTEVMAALDNNERVVLSHGGKEFALLMPVPDIEEEIQRISALPACGMWADREDMKDPTAWVREKRRRRRERLFEIASGDGK